MHHIHQHHRPAPHHLHGILILVCCTMSRLLYFPIAGWYATHGVHHPGDAHATIRLSTAHHPPHRLQGTSTNSPPPVTTSLVNCFLYAMSCVVISGTPSTPFTTCVGIMQQRLLVDRGSALPLCAHITGGRMVCTACLLVVRIACVWYGYAWIYPCVYACI